MKMKKGSGLLPALLSAMMVLAMVPVLGMGMPVYAVDESPYGLWVGGIPVTEANATDILGDGDNGAAASYDDSTKTLTLNNYSYESNGYKYYEDPYGFDFYTAIYSNRELNIVLEGNNIVKCTEIDLSYGNGIHVGSGGLTINGSGTLSASGYGIGGYGIYSGRGDITIGGGTVTASGIVGIAADPGGSIIINDGIVTAIGSVMGFSTYDVMVDDDMGINAGEDRETAIDVNKESFRKVHPQKWVQVAKAYPIWVSGKRVTVANKEDVMSDGVVSFNPATDETDATLTLKGTVTADPEHQYNYAAIYYGDAVNELNIDAAETSVVKGPDYEEIQDKNSCGIRSEGPLTVKGKLTAEGGAASYSYGITAPALVADETAEVDASGDLTGIAINNGDGAVVINAGAKLSAAGGNRAVDGIIKNAAAGLGWTDKEGSEGKTYIGIDTEQGKDPGSNIKSVKFPAPVAAVTDKPTAKNLTYNGSAQELVTAGAASGGIMQYAKSPNASATAPEEGWSTSIPKGTEAGTYYVWYMAEGDATHADSEPQGPVTVTIYPKISGTPLMTMKAKGKTSILFKWKKVNGADGYDIFFAECDHSGKKTACRNVKTIKGNTTFSWTRSGLRKGTPYKACVKAYVVRNGRKSYVRTSPTMHAFAGGCNGKYTNAKSVKVKKTKIALKKGKTFKIKARVRKLKKSKKLMPKSHAAAIRYLSTDKKVATVTRSGKIKARGKGSCLIYVYAHNGAYKQLKVTVK